jgi:hypothetical protein
MRVEILQAQKARLQDDIPDARSSKEIPQSETDFDPRTYL